MLWTANNRHPFWYRVQRLVANLCQTLRCALKNGAWQREEAGKGLLFLWIKPLKPVSLSPQMLTEENHPKYIVARTRLRVTRSPFHHRSLLWRNSVVNSWRKHKHYIPSFQFTFVSLSSYLGVLFFFFESKLKP